MCVVYMLFDPIVTFLKIFKDMLLRNEIGDNVDALHHIARLFQKASEKNRNVLFVQFLEHVFHRIQSRLIHVLHPAQAYDYVRCRIGNLVCQLLKIACGAKEQRPLDMFDKNFFL